MSEDATAVVEEAIERNETAVAQGAVELVPLSALLLSDLNVRKTERDVGIASLAESIAARGLKQNLVIVPAHFTTSAVDEEYQGENRWAGRFEVIAGGRRFQALKLLEADGRIPPDHPVPCLVEERETARETSLDENLQKEAMNPADEFEAYAAIVEEHGGGEDAVRICARRRGKTVAHVQGRLRLAALAPEILQALREDRIELDAAKAYAAVSDQALQLKVFKAQEKAWNGKDPRTIRDALRGKTLPLSDGRVKWVGLEAYLAAGGRTETEMFMGTKGEERLLDVALLNKLAQEKAEPLLAARAKQDGYKDGVLATGVGWQFKAPKPPADFKTTERYYDNPTKAQLKKSIAIYVVDSEGEDLVLRGRFKPKDEKEPARTGYTPPTAEEIAAARREEGIATLATRLATGKFAGTPFEGRAFWPPKRWIEAIEDINEDEVFVAVLIRVGKAEIEARRQEATERYDAELAEQEAEKLRQAQAAAAETDGDVEDALAELDGDQDEEAA